MVYALRKTLVIGAKGWLGSRFFKAFRTFFPDLIGTHHQTSEELLPLDLRNPKLNFPIDASYEYALIAGGWGRLSACENNPKEAFQINVEGPIKLAKQLLQKKITPIFLSTDYVFDGTKENYPPKDIPRPLNEYGRQKAELEKRVHTELQGPYLILRLSKIYGLEKGDGTLIDEMMAKLFSKQPLQAANDQFLAPLFFGDLLKGLSHLQQSHSTGLFNCGGREAISRLDLAKKVAEKLRRDENLVREISLDQWPDAIKRPKKTVLSPPFGQMPLDAAIETLAKQYS